MKGGEGSSHLCWGDTILLENKSEGACRESAHGHTVGCELNSQLTRYKTDHRNPGAFAAPVYLGLQFSPLKKLRSMDSALGSRSCSGAVSLAL